MPTKIRLLADKNILIHQNYIPGEIEMDTYNPAGGIPSDVNEYDALLVRTVNPVDKTTIPLKNSRLKFIGSATAGIDHIDIQWLKECGITFAHSPGCNAVSVGEYVAIAVFYWSLYSETDLSSMRAGFIGAGHTGRAAEQLLTRLSVRCVRYDPPKAEIEPGFQSSTLDEVLDCDILTFHTPLTNTGPWPTYHWLDSDKLKSRTYQLIINASRGGVVDEQALLNSYQKGKVRSFVLDVWENEPVFSDRTAEAAFLSTPHIAGYSIQSKQKATRMVMQSLCEFFNISAKEFDFTPPAPSVPEISEELTNRGLTGLLSELNPIREYHRLFSRLHGLTPGQKQRGFQQIRTEFPLRHEHSCFKISKEIMGRHPVLHSLGFGMKKN